MPPTKATPMTVPINNPVTRTGCSLINGTPRPASQATKMPIRTAAIILKLRNSDSGGICILPETSGLNTPMVSRMMPRCKPCFSTKGMYCDKEVCCINNKTAAEIVIELLLLTTPKKISVTRNKGTKLKFIGLRYSGQRFFCQLDHGIFDFAVRQHVQ